MLATSFPGSSQELAAADTVAKEVSIIRAQRLVGYLSRDWLRVVALVIAAVVVHAPALQGERIWDDTYLTRDNPFIKSPLLILEAFRHYLFLDSFSAHYRPVQNITYLVDYFFWNTDTYGFHLANISLHAANAVLLYFLLRHLFATLLLPRALSPVFRRAARRLPSFSLSAFVIALIWAVHPVHTESHDRIRRIHPFSPRYRPA